MAIQGKVKEIKSGYKKYVGLFEGTPVLVNPSKDEASTVGIEFKDDKQYVTINSQGNNQVNLTFWLKERVTGHMFNVAFFLIEEIDKAMSGKIRYINSAGVTTYADDMNSLPTWFTNNRKVREAYRGESALYEFLRNYLSNLDTRDPDNEIILDRTEDLFKGDFSEIKDVVNNFSKESVVAMATIRTTNDGNEYQSVYNGRFLPGYGLSYFDGKRAPTKSINKFIDDISGQYGCKDYYILEPMKEYDPNAIVVSNDAVIVEGSDNMDDLPF